MLHGDGRALHGYHHAMLRVLALWCLLGASACGLAFGGAAALGGAVGYASTRPADRGVGAAIGAVTGFAVAGLLGGYVCWEQAWSGKPVKW